MTRRTLIAWIALVILFDLALLVVYITTDHI